MNIINIRDKDSFYKAVKVLKGDGVIIFPTDTVYGIGCLLKEKAIKKLYKIKNRPLTQPTAVLFSAEIFNKVIRPGLNLELSQKMQKSFFSGKTTLIIPLNYIKLKVPKMLIKDNALGIRLPKYGWLCDLIEKTGPIVASSANPKGRGAPSNFLEIDMTILDLADLVIKTNSNLSNQPSKIYNPITRKYLR